MKSMNVQDRKDVKMLATVLLRRDVDAGKAFKPSLTVIKAAAFFGTKGDLGELVEELKNDFSTLCEE